MTAYIIVNYDITDPDKYGEYVAVAPGALKIGEVSAPFALRHDATDNHFAVPVKGL